MTPKEREAMQQALEALESYSKSDYIKKQHPKRRANGEKAITALREALEQLNCQCGDKCFPVFSGDIEYCETCGKPTALDEQATVSYGLCGNCAKKAADGWALYCVECWEKAEQEPVAWWHPKMGAYDNNYFDAMQPLYLSPVRTKDLTEAEIDEIWKKHSGGNLGFAYAVIAADREKNK